MENQLALEKQKEQAIAPLAPMAMIQVAFQKALESGGADALAVADRILEQMAKQRDYEDREAFNAALRRIQDKLKAIPKRGNNPQTNSKYAKLEDIDKEIDPLIQAEGMTLSFAPEPCDQPQMVRVVGVLSLGAYSRRYPLDMPTDGQGAKGGWVMTRTHATGSGISYGIRYIKRMIFNLRLDDDDGNKAAGTKSLDDKIHITHMTNIENAPTKQELNKFYIQAIKAAGLIGDKGSIDSFEAAAQKRFKELS